MKKTDKNIFDIELTKPEISMLDWLHQLRVEQEKNHAKGIPALQRLLPIAQGHSGQCRIVAHFLLSLYNGNRFPFDLTDFRSLDAVIFDDCIAVLLMDRHPKQEVHCYFENGGEIWEDLAKKWQLNNS